MSFATNIRTMLTGDSSLNGVVEAINYENLPENFEITKNWIVYSFNKALTERCMNGNKVFTQYNLTLKVITHDTIELESLSDYIVNMIDSSSYLKIQDIQFVSDDHTVDLDKNLYMNTMEFNVIYE